MALIGRSTASQIAVIKYRPIRPGFLRRPVTISAFSASDRRIVPIGYLLKKA
jgi:hypothetical protein